MKLSTSISLLCMTNAAIAGEMIAKKCVDIPNCAKMVSQLTGQNYIFSLDFKNKIQFAGDLEMTKNNAENIFTNILHLEGFTRLPTGTPNTWQIVTLKDARDSNVPTVKASHQMPPELPNNWDLTLLTYKANHPEILHEMARICRNHMPPDSRIVVSELTGSLILIDTAVNLKKMFTIIREMDVKPTTELKKKLDLNPH